VELEHQYSLKIRRKWENKETRRKHLQKYTSNKRHVSRKYKELLKVSKMTTTPIRK
jgi:adenylate kinase family enzyme